MKNENICKWKLFLHDYLCEIRYWYMPMIIEDFGYSVLLGWIILQIGYCIGGSFNIHSWAWSASPSVQVGRSSLTQVSLDPSHILYH